jgi:hypothetical protein
MATFTITEDNNITAFASAEEAVQAGQSTATTFDSQAGLARISAEWALSRMVDIYNGIPGNAAIRKFADRNKAVARIWGAIQPLARHAEPAPTPQPPKRPDALRPAKPVKKSQTGGSKKTAKQGSAKQGSAKKRGSDAERGGKKAAVIAMMKRPNGVTLAEIMATTSWQAHTIRGLVSTLGSKGGEKIESLKNAAGERTYRIAK